MARRRMIDPNFWESEDVSELSFFARLLFIGLVSQADDEGKGKANANYIKSLVFPYDDVRVAEVEKALSEISQKTSVILYTVDGKRYYKFKNWDKWQTINRPQPSTLPNPEGEEYSVNENTQNREEITDDSVSENLTEKECQKDEEKVCVNDSRKMYERFTEQSLNDSRPKKEIEKEEEKENKYISLSAPVRVIEDNLLPDFEEFKKNHPNVQIDTCNIGGYDFTFLSQKIKDTPYLQQMTSLSWLLKQYPRIRAGYYDKHQKPKEEKKGTGHFSGERKLSKEQYAKLVSSVDDIEL